MSKNVFARYIAEPSSDEIFLALKRDLFLPRKFPDLRYLDIVSHAVQAIDRVPAQAWSVYYTRKYTIFRIDLLTAIL